MKVNQESGTLKTKKVVPGSGIDQLCQDEAWELTTGLNVKTANATD